jgi:hypothetical protein
MLRTLSLALALCVTCLGSSHAVDVDLFGNLGTVNASTDSVTVGYITSGIENQFESQGFSVGSTAYVLSRIDLGLQSFGSPSPVVSIYTDAANEPGTPLAAFTTTSTVASKQVYSFTGSFTLSANTSYWIVLSNSNSASIERYDWYTNDASTPPSAINGSGFTYLLSKERDNVGGTWDPANMPNLSINLAGTAVPEPSTYALGLIATGVLAAMARRRKARTA